MIRPRLAPCLMLALALAAPCFAQGPDWLTRCNRQLGGNNDPETGSYLFLTRGKTAATGQSRVEFDYTASGSAAGAVYTTPAKDLLNPYGGASLSVNAFALAEGKSAPAVGQVSFRVTARDFKPIPGSPVTMKLIVDGVSFGPYAPRDPSSGMYSVWLDTADTDGDGRPPLLAPAEFAKVARAADVMKAAEVVLVQDGADIVRLPVRTTLRTAWRDGLLDWAKRTAPGVTEATFCSGSDRVVN